MTDTKYRMELFSMYDCTGIAAHLERMAEKGWLLEKAGTFLWRYRRSEPKAVHYCVAYLPGSSEMDPQPTEQNRELQDFCAEAGWEQVSSVAQMHIFRSEAEDPIPIETDPGIQVRNIHAAMKRNFLPSQIILLLLAVWNLAMRLWDLRNPVTALNYLSSSGGQVAILCWVLIIFMTLLELGSYFLWRRRALAAAREEGIFLPTRGTRKYQRVYLSLLGLILLVWLALAAEPGEKFLIAAMLALIPLIFGVVFGVKHLCKKLGASRNVARVAVFATAFVMTTVVLSVTVFGVLSLADGFFGREVETYEYLGSTFEAYHDELPLYVEDLTETDYDRYSTYMTTQRSPIMTNRSGLQQPRVGDEGGAMLCYNIYDVHFGFLRGWVRQKLFEANSNDQVPTEYPVNGVLVSDFSYDKEIGFYILTYENRVALLSADWRLTDEQLETAIEILMK